MINRLLALVLRAILGLRYRVQVKGLDAVCRKGTSGLLLLPNHPALIEPIILACHLHRGLKVRALADETQIDRFLVRTLARRINVLSLPDLTTTGAQSVRQVRAAIGQCAEALQHGDNLILYPAGRICRQNREQIGANSAVERILKAAPDARIVLVRTRGLWGSRFSWALGHRPLVMPTLRQGFKALLLNGLFFTPRRTVEIELTEPEGFPIQAGRREINQYLETFYNESLERNTYGPYSVWERGGIEIRPEPQPASLRDSLSQISPAIRRQVMRHLQDVTGVTAIRDDMSLVRDLGMDSLATVDLITWLENEYGYSQIDVDSLGHVEDVLLAASGQAVSAGETTLHQVPRRWFRARSRPGRPERLADMTIPEAFLYQARHQPDKAIVADQLAGVKTYRDMVLAIILLRRQIAALPGEYLGIMLPASVAVSIVYLAALFTGKTPVMVNWTLGRRNLKHTLDTLGVAHIVTAQALLSRIAAQGIELDDLMDRFLPLEQIRGGISRWDKLAALVKSRLSWSQLRQVHPSKTAVVLFTSGSESVPKAVPLTHRNILRNVADAYECFTLAETDGFLGILPPFHSFGLTVSLILPLTLGTRVVYYPNPTHGGMLGGLIDAYKLTILLGTPTFLNGILRASRPEQLGSLRLVVSGAEKCPERIYDTLATTCPGATVLEGYGITECSPVVSVNHENDPQRGTIGKIMPSLEYAIVSPDSQQRLTPGREGLLLVRGDSVFPGYLNHEGAPPFIEFEGRQWYRTGDLVVEDHDGVLTFRGRLKRFVKLGGEMVSLPAIESVLEQHFADPESDGPTLAVVAAPVEENPDIVLFCTDDIAREEANRVIRAAGLSGLHNIRQVIHVDALPLLGTGKIDHKALVAQLARHS
ncbi:MAG: AMP-binding protein [Phycisphaerales bacterium]|nr:MAG: AMP-binding protein [Phycisphaerales bacterium]